MKADLLDAQESVDWAIANIEPFEMRLKGWLNENTYLKTVETPLDETHDWLVAGTKADLPLAFNVEAGAYINAIRSALDILAWSIGKRDMVLFPDEICFPVANSEEEFRTWNYKGSKFVGQLSGDHRTVLELYKPYKGGNDLLYSLHQLDIVRKHKRLLSTYMRPAKYNVMGWGLSGTFKPNMDMRNKTADDETIFGFLAKGAAQPEINYTAHVIFGVPGVLSGEPLIGTLHSFAGLTHTIINSFDF